MVVGEQEAERFGFSISSTWQISSEYGPTSQPGVCDVNQKCTANVIIKLVCITMNAKNTIEISTNLIIMRYEA